MFFAILLDKETAYLQRILWYNLFVECKTEKLAIG